MAEVPADEREALFAKLGADDDGELDAEGETAEKRLKRFAPPIKHDKAHY